MTIFEQIRAMNIAYGNTVGQWNFKQTELYVALVKEEALETLTAFDEFRHNHSAMALEEVADGAIDIIVVAIGLLHSIGIDPQKAWDEVLKTNMAKVNPATGFVTKNSAGKVQKPDGWTKPNLLP